MIRPATLQDAKEYFTDRNLTVGDEMLLPCYVLHEKCLFTIEDLGDYSAEVHICIKRDNVRLSRWLTQEVMRYMKDAGFKQLITSAAPKYGTANNLALKLGFVFIGCYNGQNHYGVIL